MRKITYCYLALLINSFSALGNEVFFRAPGNYLLLGRVVIEKNLTRIILQENSMAEIDLFINDPSSKALIDKYKSRRIIFCANVLKPCGQICEADKILFKKLALPWDEQKLKKGFYKPADKLECR